MSWPALHHCIVDNALIQHTSLMLAINLVLHVPTMLKLPWCICVQKRSFCNMLVGCIAALLLARAPRRWNDQGPRLFNDPASRADCAARWDTHLANNRRLLFMTWGGLLLQYCSTIVFLYTVKRLQRSPSAFASEAARERFTVVSSRVMGIFSTVGKLLVRPVIPWVLLSQAIFFYRCIDRYQGGIKIMLSSLLSLVYVYGVCIIESWGPSED